MGRKDEGEGKEGEGKGRIVSEGWYVPPKLKFWRRHCIRIRCRQISAVIDKQFVELGCQEKIDSQYNR
jgi:hypothetical protein